MLVPTSITSISKFDLEGICAGIFFNIFLLGYIIVASADISMDVLSFLWARIERDFIATSHGSN